MRRLSLSFHAACRLLAFACLLLVKPSHAFHTNSEHITDDTAFTAEGGSFRFGLYKLEYALHDRFTAGTYIWPWLFKTSSLFGKWRFYAGERWNWALRLGFFRLNTSAFDKASENAPIFTVVPFELASSYKFDGNDQLSQSLVFTAVRLAGDIDNDSMSGAAEGGVSNLQYLAAYEHRYSKRTALVITGRYLLAQVARANADVVLHPDEFTTIEIHGSGSEADALNFRAAFSIVPAFVWSWDTFNLRLGLGYGNLNVPGVNFVLPNKSPLLDIDLYWVLD
jgi:hypothetical protein